MHFQRQQFSNQYTHHLEFIFYGIKITSIFHPFSNSTLISDANKPYVRFNIDQSEVGVCWKDGLPSSKKRHLSDEITDGFFPNKGRREWKKKKPSSFMDCAYRRKRQNRTNPRLYEIRWMRISELLFKLNFLILTLQNGS